VRKQHMPVRGAMPGTRGTRAGIAASSPRSSRGAATGQHRGEGREGELLPRGQQAQGEGHPRGHRQHRHLPHIWLHTTGSATGHLTPPHRARRGTPSHRTGWRTVAGREGRERGKGGRERGKGGGREGRGEGERQREVCSTWEACFSQSVGYEEVGDARHQTAACSLEHHKPYQFSPFLLHPASTSACGPYRCPCFSL